MAVALGTAARRLMEQALGGEGKDAAAAGPAPPTPAASAPRADDSRAEADALRRELAELRASNRHLQAALHAAQAGSASMRGFLSKHRAGVASDGAGKGGPFVPWGGLFAQEWELRYFVLSGTLLRWFGSDRDVALAPRGVLDVQGCVVEVEGSSAAGGGGKGGGGDKGGGGGGVGAGSGPFRFRVVEPPPPGRPGGGGKVLLRLSSENRLAAEQWVAALEASGVRVAAVAGGGGGGGGGSRPSSARHACPPAAVQDRWEQSSVDSELPEALPRRRGPPPARPPAGGGGLVQRWARRGGGGGGSGGGGGGGGGPRDGGGGGGGRWLPMPALHSDGPGSPGGGASRSPSSGRASAPSSAPLPTSPGGERPAQRSREGGGGGSATTGDTGNNNNDANDGSSGGGGGGASLGASPSAATPEDAAAQRFVARLKRSPMSGSTPVYTSARGSYLSSDGAWRAKHDGLLNLGAMLLVVGNLRLILENLIRYGVRVDPVRYVRGSLLRGTGNLPLVLCFPLLAAAALASVGVERLAAALARRDALAAARLRKQAGAMAALAAAGAAPAAAAAAAAGAKKKVGGGKVGGKGGGGAEAAAAAAARRLSRLAGEAAAGRRGSEALVLLLAALVSTVALVAPSAVVVRTRADIAPALLLTMCAIVTWAKLVSYHHCCHDCRGARRRGGAAAAAGDSGGGGGAIGGASGDGNGGNGNGGGNGGVKGGGEGGAELAEPEPFEPTEAAYPRPGERGAPGLEPVAWAVRAWPENLTACDMLWYLAAPTLTYQVNFPRSDRVRKGWLLRRVGELLLGIGLGLVIVDQVRGEAQGPGRFFGALLFFSVSGSASVFFLCRLSSFRVRVFSKPPPPSPPPPSLARARPQTITTTAKRDPRTKNQKPTKNPSVHGARLRQQPGAHRRPRLCPHGRARAQAGAPESVRVAGDRLLPVPLVVQRARGADAVRRPRVLQGLVRERQRDEREFVVCFVSVGRESVFFSRGGVTGARLFSMSSAAAVLPIQRPPLFAEQHHPPAGHCRPSVRTHPANPLKQPLPRPPKKTTRPSKKKKKPLNQTGGTAPASRPTGAAGIPPCTSGSCGQYISRPSATGASDATRPWS